MDLEKFVLNSLHNGLNTSQIVQELKTKGISKTRKNINNIITSMRKKGIEIPFLKKIKVISKNKTPLLLEHKKHTKDHSFLVIVGSNKDMLKEIIKKAI